MYSTKPFAVVTFWTGLLVMTFATHVAGVPTVPCVAQDDDPFGSSAKVEQSEPLENDQSIRTEAIVERPAGNARHAVSFPTRLSEETREILKEPITINYVETPFSDVASDLEERLGVNIILDQSALEDSLSEDEPISIRLRVVPGNYALRLLLGKKNATYLVQAGVIRIISLDVSDDPNYFVRKVFGADDLLAAINRWNHLHRDQFEKPATPNLPGSPPTTAPATNESSSKPRGVFHTAAQVSQFGGGGGGGFGYGAVSGQGPFETSRQTRAGTQLTNLIFESVDQDQWSELGNGHATLSLVSGQLVIFGSETLVSDVDELLSDLRSRLVSE